MKKALALVLAFALAFSLAACGKGASSSTAATASSGSAAASSGGAQNNGEIYEVVMQFPTLGTTPKDIQLVEDAINARTESEIGVHVTLYPATAFDLNSTTNLMISSGEKLDLAMCMFEGGVGSYVNKGALLELDDLFATYGKDIAAAEGVAMSGGYFDGKLYGIPTEEKMGRVKAFFARKDLVDKYNIAYDPEHIYTYEELSDIFATVKAGEGSSFYCVGINANEEGIYTYMDPVDYLGSGLASGCLPNYGVGSTDIINYFETEGFAQECNVAHDWYQKGYLSPDCNTATDSGQTQVLNGGYFGYFSNAEPDMIATINVGLDSYLDTEVVPFYTTVPAAMTQNYQVTLWMIPTTCDNPEKTMQWLNLMYADQDIINLLYRGIEGTHYEFVEGSDTVVKYLDGVDGSNVTYNAVLNVWGDKSKDYVMAPLDETYYQHLKDFNASIDAEHTSGALGYCFNSNTVKTQYAAVSSVISEYQASLGLGVVDPAVVLPEFLDALSAAGMAEVIAENQTQFDAWRAQQGNA